MLFSEIRPFVRYAHTFSSKDDKTYESKKPYDNRLFYIQDAPVCVFAENKAYNLHPGDILLIPSGVSYRLRPSNQKASCIGINFDYTQAHRDLDTPIPPIDTVRYDPAKQLENLRFSDYEEFNGVLHVSDAGELSGKLHAIVREYDSKLLCFASLCSNLLSEILVESLRKTRNQSNRGSTDTAMKIISYINEAYAAPLSNRSVAEVFHLHPNYVSAIVKELTGQSLHQYLLHVRVAASVRLLTATDVPIGEIARRCGFSDIYHYSKCFKRVMGVSPSHYL